jgi:hypothetical protein
VRGELGGGDDRQLSCAGKLSWVSLCTELFHYIMVSIVTDEEVFAQFKEDSRKQYNRMWHVLL